MTFTVAPVAPGELTAACRVLFFTGPSRPSGFDPDGLFVAKDRRGAIIGAVLVQVLAGATGVIVPPRVVVEAEVESLEDSLVSIACRWLHSRGVKICQAFALEAEQSAMAALERGGFRRVTQLSNMRWEVGPEKERGNHRVAITVLPYAPDLHDEFLATLMATYDGTLDCPELDGVRTAEEVFAGFSPEPGRSAGLRFLVTHRGQSVGVVLLDRVGETEEWEVSYLGLIASARGRGLGARLVQLVQDEAIAAHIRALNLSVDVRNIPAIRSYRRHGFFEYDRLDVYLAIWQDELLP